MKSSNIQKAEMIRNIEQLIKMFGEDKTLKDIKHSLPLPEGFECPKCSGTGTYTETYDAYPKGFPDSGWVSDMKTRLVECDACSGMGYTDKPLRPKMV